MKDLTTEEIIKDLLNIIEDIIAGSRIFLRQLDENRNIPQDEFDKQTYKLNQVERKVKELKKEST